MHPETLARLNIDQQLCDAGWQVQDRMQMNLYAGLGVAVREYPLATGFADYLLFVDRKAVGIIEAKAEGATLSGAAEQAGLYVTGLPQNIPHVMLPLPFQYESTGVETLFRDNRDPQPRSRRIFTFHRPETLAEWAAEAETMRQRLQQFPLLQRAGLWSAQAQAIQNLEQSFAKDQPRALIQMATGSGKTFTAVSAIYRLIKFARARRVLFLVDRSNLARQTYKEFQAYTTPDDGRKFTELYNVQHLQTNAIGPVNKVVITTIQRLYSILSGEADFAGDEEGSLFELGAALEGQAPKEVRYNPRLPVEFFDFIITDECHRSIYNLWRGVLEYFDAFLIGLTATPSKQTLGFFNQNLVMEYSRQRAVADGVNVDGEVYRIRTRISDQGNTVEAGEWVGKRDKLTRAQRLELLDQEFAYDPAALDRAVVAPNQIRTALQTFKERLPSEIFPGRTEVPKTLIFAKDDSHAEDIVHIARQVFGRGDEFCKKITYRVAGVAPEQLISDFRNAYNPRMAVTVDMIATGTDIKPVEILIFMRAVKSRILFEQMLGRGTRVIDETDLRAVNPGEGIRKDHFVIVDMVGIIEQEKVDTQTLERKRSTPFPRLLGLAAAGAIDEEVVSSLAGRLIRLRRDFTQADQRQVEALTGAGGLPAIIDGLLAAIDPDQQEAEAARLLAEAQFSGRMPSVPTAEPTAEEMAQAAQRLMEAAVRPLAANPALRNLLIEIQKRHEQVIDESADKTTLAAFDDAAAERARGTIASFEAFIEEHKDEITALQIIYSIPRITPVGAHGMRPDDSHGMRPGDSHGTHPGDSPEMATGQPPTIHDTPSPPTTAITSVGAHGMRPGDSPEVATRQPPISGRAPITGRTPSAPTLTFAALKELAERLQQPPHSWTTEGLWRAYAALERDRVRGANQRRVLTDLVSLVRHAVQLDEQLEPYPERVARRYQEWIAAQETQGRQFSPAQRWWLDKIAAHIGVNLSIRPEDLDGGEFFNRGGRVAAMKALGKDWRVVLEELNEVLA